MSTESNVIEKEKVSKPLILTIAGSDPSGGAGIQADLKVIHLLGGFALSVITGLTAQNSTGIKDIFHIPANFIATQLKVIFEDFTPKAIKTGMLGDIEQIQSIIKILQTNTVSNFVLDPVIYSKNRKMLINPEAKDILMKELFPLATIVTPNAPEAEFFSGMQIKTPEDMILAGQHIIKSGVKYVLIKGGHIHDKSWDLLIDRLKYSWIKGDRVNSIHTHGTGCTLSSAIATFLGLGYNIVESCQLAKEFLTYALKSAYNIGSGIGALNHDAGAKEFWKNHIVKSDINIQ